MNEEPGVTAIAKCGLMALAIVALAALAGYAQTAAGAESVRFECTGGEGPFIVPAGVTQLHVEVHGGRGQTRDGSQRGGYGGIVIATVPVTPGEGLNAVPGCAGNQHHNFGWGSGGDHGIAHGAYAEDGGFGGGGSAVVTFDGTELVVAGGGGGDGGDGGFGGLGGQGGAGGNGGINPQPGGRGCTAKGCPNAGGSSGGEKGGCASCADGIAGEGGTSSSAFDDGGGGGGGGHVGGGGGHGGSGFGGIGDGAGGGGGGSSYVISGATNVRYGIDRSGGDGDGIVILTWSVGTSDGRPMPILLAPLEGKSYGEACAINKWGEVAGFSSDGANLATVWDRDGQPRALAPLAGDRASRAFAINDRGEAAGVSSGATTSAVRWRRNGGALRLAPPEGDRESFARGINRHGEVVGYSTRRDAAASDGTMLQAVRWSIDGNPTVLEPLYGDLEAIALAINDRGLVFGYSFRTGDPALHRAVVWNQYGEPSPLSATDSKASAINRRGLVVGDREDGDRVATLWSADRDPRGLAVLDGYLDGQAFAINQRGTAVGVSQGETTSAVIWPRAGAPIALDPLPGDQDSWAWDINRGGDVVGFSVGATGSSAVLWPARRQKPRHRHSGPFGRP